MLGSVVGEDTPVAWSLMKSAQRGGPRTSYDLVGPSTMLSGHSAPVPVWGGGG